MVLLKIFEFNEVSANIISKQQKQKQKKLKIFKKRNTQRGFIKY